MAALALRRSGLSGGLDLLNIQPEEPPPTVAPAAAPADSWSTTTLETLPEDALASVLAQLGSSVDQLVVACVSSSLCDAVSRSWARDALLLSSDPHLATDQLLLQLTLGRLARGLVRELDIAGCDLLTKSAVTRAAMAQRTIQRLNGTNVGVGSWTPEQLLRVIAALDDLRVLTADCRSLGASSPLLRLLAHPAVRLRKLVLHKPESGAALEPAADDLVSLTAALCTVCRRPRGHSASRPLPGLIRVAGAQAEASGRRRRARRLPPRGLYKHSSAIRAAARRPDPPPALRLAHRWTSASREAGCGAPSSLSPRCSRAKSAGRVPRPLQPCCSTPDEP